MYILFINFFFNVFLDFGKLKVYCLFIVYIFFFYIVDLFMIVELVYDLFLGFVLDVFSYIYLGINMFIFKGGM